MCKIIYLNRSSSPCGISSVSPLVNMKPCCCKHLQIGVLIGILISFLIWLGALIFYIPYVCLYYPTKLDPNDVLKIEVVPNEKYEDIMLVSAVFILLALFADRKEYRRLLLQSAT